MKESLVRIIFPLFQEMNKLRNVNSIPRLEEHTNTKFALIATNGLPEKVELMQFFVPAEFNSATTVETKATLDSAHAESRTR